MTIGRRVVNVAQKARGKEPIKYELEVIPYTAWEIPAEYERLLFCWERGSKLFVTDAEEVRNNRSVVWRQFLKQTATFYKGPSGFEPKEFAFKLQSAKASSKGSEERKTVAKVHVDLSQYCTGQVNPQPVEKTFTLKPFGKLKVSIRASWLKDASLDPDAMTEMTGTSYGRRGDDSTQDDEYYDETYEQDLSGFVAEGQEGDGSTQPPRRSSRHSRSGRPRSKHRHKLPDDIPEDPFEEPEERPSREHRKPRRPKLEVERSDAGQPGRDGATLQTEEVDLSSGQRLQTKTWRDYLCCCIQPKVVLPPVETQEDQELLPQKHKLRRSDR